MRFSHFFLAKNLPMLAANRELLDVLAPQGHLFDFGQNFEQHAIHVFITGAKGGIFKTDTAINLGAAIARMKYENVNEFVRAGLLDTNAGQMGIKSKLKDLIPHPYGLYEFMASVGTDREFNIFDQGFYKMNVDPRDPNKILRVFPLYGENFPSGDVLEALKIFCDSGLNRRPRTQIEMKIHTAKLKFQKQLMHEIDKKLDVILFDTSNHVEAKNTQFMRRHPKNCVVLMTDPMDVESVNGSMSYIQSLLSDDPKHKTQIYPRVLLVFNSDPQASPLFNNVDFVKTIISKFSDVREEVLREHLFIEQIMENKEIKKHNASQGTPWVLSSSSKFSEAKLPLARLAGYVVNGRYSKDPEKKETQFNKFLKLMGLRS